MMRRILKGKKMASTGLRGPHALNEANIDAKVDTSIGAYALGYVNSEEVFVVKYVGRSDSDLNKRLKDWVGSYKSFKYGHFETKKAAFERECRMFHDFGGTGSLDNDIHPARPKGTNHDCPVSACTDLD
jgi:hypothetical protein